MKIPTEGLDDVYAKSWEPVRTSGGISPFTRSIQLQLTGPIDVTSFGDLQRSWIVPMIANWSHGEHTTITDLLFEES